MNSFTIELTSEYADWWRYNVRILCELQDSAGRRTGFASASAKDDRGCCVLTTMPCDRLRTFIYVIPDQLPVDRVVGEYPDFEAELRVSCGKRIIADERVTIGRWGGASIARICEADRITEV